MFRDFLISGIGFAFFIICPRMAAMVYVIAKNSNVSLIYTTLFGSVVAMPLVVIMALVFVRFGLWGALAFCVLTDLCAALILKEISMEAGIETLVVALFVIMGVKVAPYVVRILVR